MGDKDTSKDLFRAIAVPHPAVLDSSALWAAQSSYDQAGNTAGVPADQDGSSLVLEASGAQTASSELRYRIQRGGMPGHGYTAGKGWPTSAIWQRNGDTDWMGWQPPTSIWGYEYLTQDGAAGNEKPAIITLANGDILRLGANDNAPAVELKCSRYDAATNAWQTSVSIDSVILSGLGYSRIDAVQLPTGRILALYLVEDELTTTEIQMRVASSDDNGATWALYADYVIDGTSSLLDTDTYTIRRMRAEYSPATGEILVCVWGNKSSGTYTEHMLQYASRDLGASFEYIGQIGSTDTDDDQSNSGDIVLHDGVFVIISTNPSTDAAVNGGEVFRLGSAFQAVGNGGAGDPFAVANFVSATGSQNRVAACVDDRGVIWCYMANTSPAVDNVAAFFSQDGGLSWAETAAGTVTSGYGSVFAPGVNNVQPIEIACTWQRGRVVLICQHVSPSTTSDDDMLTALYLGGFSTVTLPYRSSALSTIRTRRDPSFVTGFARDFVPFELPENDGWTLFQSGTNAGSITTGALNLTSTAAGYRTFYVTTTNQTAMRFHGITRCTSGASYTRLTYDDGSAQRQAVVEITPTTISLIDNAGPTTRGSASHGGGYVEFLFEIDASTATVWWRDWTTSEERSWETPLSGSVGAVGTADGSGTMLWGALSSSDDDVDWLLAQTADGGALGSGNQGFTNPDDLHGYPLGAGERSAAYIGDGVSVWGVDGPAAAGEDWHIDTRYEYPIQRIFPGTTPSPTVGWRSSTTTASMAIAWRRSTSGFESRAYNGLECLWLDGINFRQAQLQRTRNDGSSWTDEVEIVNYVDVTFSRVGDIVYPGNGTPADGIYLHEGELAGGFFEDGAGKVRKIKGNTAGAWVIGSSNSQNAAIFLEDADDTEAASGTGEIWFPRVLVVFSPYTCDGLRIQISDDGSGHTPPEGYWKIGNLWHGRVIPFGRDYSLGRVVSQSANTEIITDAAGRRRSRVRGATRRTVSVAFPAIDVTQYSEEGQPDSIEVNATFGTLTTPDEPVKLPGLLEYLRGPDRLCLYIPRLDRFSGADGNVQYNLHRAEGAILGRLTSGVTLTSIAGDESSSEVLSVAQITIEEEI